MVLYHAVSTYQLIEFILHRIQRNKKNAAAIIISTDIVRRFSNYETMLNNYFDKIIIYDNADLSKKTDKPEILEKVFNKMFHENNICIDELEDIYVGCAHAAFAVYLSLQKKTFVFFEDAAGALSNVEGLITHVQKGSKERDELLKKLGLYDGTGECIKKRIYNFSAQSANLNKLENDEDFNVAVELEKISNNERDEIVRYFFPLEKINVSSDSVLLLTEHLANLGVLTWEEQALMYQLIKDYFLFEYNLVIKTHPDDVLHYKHLFPNSDVIYEKFPSELLPFVFSDIPKCLATVSSTAFWGLKDCFEKILIFNQSFSYHKQEFYSLHRYYVALQYINKLNEGKEIECYLLNVNDSIVLNMSKFTFSEKFIYDIKVLTSVEQIGLVNQNSYVIIDALELQYEDLKMFWNSIAQLPSNITVIFINSDNRYSFYHHEYKQLWKYMHPIAIKKKVFREAYNYQPIDEEMIYIYCKDGVKLMNNIQKKLDSTGIIVDTEEFSGDELRIKILEGILEATEKRLLYYIEKEERENKEERK